MYVTQSAVSRSIANLEDALGCPLFRRLPRGVALTCEGEMLYFHVSLAFEELEIGEKAVIQYRSTELGTIRLGATKSSLCAYLFPKLEEFQIRYPNLKINIYGHTTTEVIHLLKSGMVDLAVAISPIPQVEHFSMTFLSRVEDVFVARKGYLADTEREYSLEELSHYQIICLSKGTSTRRHLEEWFHSDGVEIITNYNVSTPDMVMPFVMQKRGIGFLPASLAENEIRSGEVVPLKIKGGIPHRYLYLIRNKKIPLSMICDEFAQIMAEGTDMDGDSKRLSLKIKRLDGEETEYTLVTKESYLLGALEQEGLVTGRNTRWGYMITTIDGIETNHNTDCSWWKIYKRGKECVLTADTFPVYDGDSFEIEYVKSNM